MPLRLVRPTVTRLCPMLARVVAALALSMTAALAGAAPVAAADVTLEPRPLLDGHVRAGSWAGVVVTIRNTGPAINGELRLTSGAEARTSYGTLVELPTNSVKEYVLYAQPAVFRTTLTVSLLSEGTEVANASVRITSHDPFTSVVGIVAERPQGITGDVTTAARAASDPNAAVVSLTPADLPGRVEGWSGIDRLIWQDVDAAQLSVDQLHALTTWLGAGGRLVILGGTTGAASLAAFPNEILPFRPTSTVDAAPTDLASLIGAPPADAEPLPALSGELLRGVALARTGESVVAARTRVGQGSVAVIGFDPAAPWLRDTSNVVSLWRRLLPPASSSRSLNPLVPSDDSQIVSAITNNLPAAELPRLEQLFALLGGYILLIGPVNYLVLRRIDRREWAWITMPLLVVVFSIGSWSLGRVLKGSDAVVNQVAIVTGAAGTDTGVAQVYVGVFSPTRQSYDVRVSGNSLLSIPISQQNQGGTFEQPLDVLQGETARLRGYAVGYGVVRAFRAESASPAPRISQSLRYVDGRLQGEIRNESDAALEATALVFGGAATMLADLIPGERRSIDMPVAAADTVSVQLSERLFGPFAGDTGQYQRVNTRRAVIEQLNGYGKFGTNGALGDTTPLLLGWRPTAALDVDLGTDAAPHVVGETLYVVALAASYTGAAEFPDRLLARTVLDTDAAESSLTGEGFQLSRGTLVAELRPPSFDGELTASGLSILMTQNGAPLAGPVTGTVRPLPDDEQPDQEDPVGDGVGAGTLLPALQLWDRSERRWVEFPAVEGQTGVGAGAYRAFADPDRYVDESGAFLVRFVNRGEPAFFGIAAALEGTIR